MPPQAEQLGPEDIWDSDQLVEIAIVPVEGEGDGERQLESVKRLVEMAKSGERQAFDGLYMAAVLQPDSSVYEEVVAGLKEIMETSRSPEFRGIAANTFYGIEKERQS